jgi:asparagine synthase (glutamine-hydrolysing)
VKAPDEPLQICRFWSLEFRSGAVRSSADWIEEYRERFADAVESHLVADVPVGVFLSGGLDSSSIVAFMARSGHRDIRTFSIGFGAEFSGFDERPRARQVASRYGTIHEEVTVDPDVRDVIRKLGALFDEPMGDSGAVPNAIVCQMAREHLKVVLSGLGGDELGGGYERYLGVTLAEQYRRFPGWFRDTVQRAVEGIPESRNGNRGVDRAKRFVRSAGLPWVERYFAFVSPLSRERRASLYAPCLREAVDLDSVLTVLRQLASTKPDHDLINELLHIDTNTYLVDDLLTVTDRVSMAVSLEARVPLLDHPLVEFMATMPGDLKVRRWEKKYLMKRAVARDLPREVVYGKKSGFSLPIARWLREDLRPQLEEALSPERIQQQGLFQSAAVEALKTEHFDRRRNHSGILWALLMFQLWAENYLT